MQPFYLQQPLRFSCNRCGECCATAGEYYAQLNEAESEKIREHRQLSRSWFRRRYLRRLDDGGRVLVSAANERCIFLNSDGSCRVYPVRPLQCRTYPFWPELVNSATAWQRESRRCEGINRGPEVARGKVSRAVQACQRYEQD